MAVNPYKPQESKPQEVAEPAVAYQQVVSDAYLVTGEERISIMKAKEQFARREYCTQEEMDKKVADIFDTRQDPAKDSFQ